MLNTLWKHEIKATGKTMSSVYVVFAIATLLVCALSLGMRNTGSGVMGVLFSISLFFYVITLIVLMTGSLIYLCWRFYHTMYSPQGYLTHTLPVKTSWILNCKVVTSVFYYLLACAACLLSVAVTGMVSTGEGFGFVIDVVRETISEGAGEFRMSEGFFVAFMITVSALACLNYLLLFFAGSSIGQLAKRSKGAVGIAAGIGLYYVSQIATVLLAVIGYFIIKQLGFSYRVIPFSVILLQMFWICVYYMINRVILARHLNLE